MAWNFDERTSENRFGILVCIDGSEQSYRSLRYAARLGRGVDADIVLLYVRPADQGLRSGGFQVSLARQNMLDWGLELPGIKYLKKGRDLLLELGDMSEDWEQKSTHTEIAGDPLGDNRIEYINEQGKKIVLKLKVAPDIATGILEQRERGQYDLIILGAPSRRQGTAIPFGETSVAERVAQQAPCSVLVARALEEGHGHLICTDGSEKATEMVRRDAVLASRCDCAISLLTVSPDVEGEPAAARVVAEAKAMVESMGIEVVETITRVGNPVDEIIDVGPDYSLIVLSDTSKSGLKRLFVGSAALKILQNAFTSVMIVR